MHYDGAKLRWANRRVHTPEAVFGEVYYEPGGFCGPRVQRDFELVVLHSGDCQVSVDDRPRNLAVGLVYLFLPGHREHFRFSHERESHHSYCSIAPRLVPHDLAEQAAAGTRWAPQSEVFRMLLGAAFKARTPHNRSSRRLVNEMALCLLLEFLNAAQREEQLGMPQAVREFVHYVEDHFGDEGCLKGAHRAASISRNGLIDKMRRLMNTTPARFLWRYRVERGAALLAETGHTVAEISYQCGFANPFHFSRLVRRYLGVAPSQIREKAWTRPHEGKR